MSFRRSAYLVTAGLVVVTLAALIGGAVTSSASGMQVASPQGSVVVRSGRGAVLFHASGELIGHFDSGRLIAALASRPRVLVFGARRIRSTRAATIYIGTKMRFSVRGSYNVRIYAVGMSLIATGHGTVALSNSGFFHAGTFSVGGGRARPLPFAVESFSFGHR
jgi:hypothetical protein